MCLTSFPLVAMRPAHWANEAYLPQLAQGQRSVLRKGSIIETQPIGWVHGTRPWRGQHRKPRIIARRLAAKRKATVDRGQLSVDLSQADIQTVLAQIGGQAGVAVYIGPIERRTISTQFTGGDLTQGLQRLLRLASLNYMILYTRGPTGAVVMKEVRVFGDGTGRTAVTPLSAQRDIKDVAAVEAAEAAAAQQFAATLAQAASPSANPGEESEAARSFREALEQAQQRTQQPGAGSVPQPQKDLPQGRQETSEGTQSEAGTAR